MAGFNVALACDADPLVRKTHESNHAKTRFLCERVERLDRTAFEHALSSCASPVKLTELDLVVGGPPCQGFSVIGPRQSQDERNALVLAFAQTVTSLRPKAFIMENVGGILSTRTVGGRVLDQAIRTLSTASYVVTQPVQVLNAADYGVPQSRRRAFVIGVRGDIAPYLLGGMLGYPDKTHSGKQDQSKSPGLPLGDLPAYVTLEDAISDLPAATRPAGEILPYPDRRKVSGFQRLMRQGADALYNHHTKGVQAQRIARIKALKPGDNATKLPERTQSGGLAGQVQTPTLRSAVSYRHSPHRQRPLGLHPSRA